MVRLTDDPARDELPAWSPDGQQVAFVRRSEGQRDIYRVPSLGGLAVGIGSCTLSPISNPSWSPDGKWIARSDAPTSSDARRILLLNVETGELVTLTQPEEGSRGDTYPIFSPDGESVAFVRSDSNGLSDLFRISVASGVVERITHDRRPILGVDWLADGRELVFASDRESRVALWRVPANGGDVSVFPLADQQVIRPSVSRSARALVYTKYTDDTNIWSVPIDEKGAIAGDPTPVIASSREDYYPQVSPSGDRLAFVSGRTGYTELWTSDLDGTHLIRHTHFEGASVGSPGWSRDGQTLIFDARIDGHTSLYTVGARESVPTKLTTASWDELNGSWSHDSTSIYFASMRSGSWQVWKRSLSDGSTVQMTRHGGFRALEGQDGSTLYFTKPDSLGVWRISTPQGRETLVIDDLWVGDTSNWTLTGSGILYVRRSPRVLAHVEFATGQTQPLGESPERVPVADASSLSLSSRPARLFYAQIDGGGLEHMFVSGY